MSALVQQSPTVSQGEATDHAGSTHRYHQVRLPNEVYEQIRNLAFKHRTTHQAIILEAILEKAAPWSESKEVTNLWFWRNQ